MLKVEFVSLVNLILDRDAVRELFQTKFTLETLENELNLLLNSEERRRDVFADYAELRQLMGEAGTSKITANKMVNYLNTSKK